MKYGIQCVLANVCSILCAGGAIYVMTLGLDGWGWLIFASIITHCWLRTQGD